MPVFLVSTSAQVDVDGYNVISAWWVDDPQDYVLFDQTVVSRTQYDSLIIQVDIELQNTVVAKSIFDIDLQFDFSNSSVSVIKFQLLNPSKILVADVDADIIGNRISIYDLQYKEDVSYIRIQFDIQSPTWVAEVIEGTFTIDGSSYTFQKGMTWAEWIASAYNTRGLFIDNGKVYTTDKKLMYNDSIVSADSYIIEDGLYTLEELESVPTVINFYIRYYKLGTSMNQYTQGMYQADYQMTWQQWIESSYNDLGLEASGDYIGSPEGYGIVLIDNASHVILLTDEIIENYSYYMPYNNIAVPFALTNYYYDFEVSSISVVVEDEKGLLETIVSYLKNQAMSIGNAIGSVLKDLFIPNADRLEDMIIHAMGDYSTKFGVLADAVDIIDNITSAFTYEDTQSTVRMPEVSVMLAGAEFTFGGYEVDVVPDGFESIVDILKVLINMVCTVSFVFAMKRRFTEVLSK